MVKVLSEEEKERLRREEELERLRAEEAERSKKAREKEDVVFRKEGRLSGIDVGGRTFLGLSPKEVREIAERDRLKKEVPTGFEDISAEAQRETFEREAFAKTGLEERFARGEFEFPEQVPIIDPALTGDLRVIKDIMKELGSTLGITALQVLGAKKVGVKERRFPIDLSKEPKTNAELQMQTTLMLDTTQQGINEVLTLAINNANDEVIRSLGPVKLKPIKEKAVIGIPPAAAVVGTATALILGAAVFDALRQAIGTDKMIKNLEAAIINYDQIPLDIFNAVDNGLPPEIAFTHLQTIEDSINALEDSLQLAAITSPNVRVSLRGVEIESKIKKVRGEIVKMRFAIARKQLDVAFGVEQLPSSVAFLQQMSRRYA